MKLTMLKEILTFPLDKFIFHFLNKIFIFPMCFIHKILLTSHPIIPHILFLIFLFGSLRFDRNEEYKKTIYIFKNLIFYSIYITFVLDFDKFLIYYITLLNKHSYHSSFLRDYIFFIREFIREYKNPLFNY
jgi:hypothetical protein